MGRDIKRVNVEKAPPMGEPWAGYRNPHYRQCPQAGVTCFGGSNAAAVYLEHLTSMFAVVAESASKGSTHPYLNTLPYGSHHPQWSKQPEEVRRQAVDFYYAITGEKPLGWFEFTGSGYKLYFRLLELAGIRTDADGTDEERGYEWGRCSVCHGDNLHPDIREAYEAWQPTEPEPGDGWQVWENVSEGSPVTPAFATREELIDYLVNYGDLWDQQRGDGGWARENAESFLEHEYHPSLIMADGKAYAPRDGQPIP